MGEARTGRAIALSLLSRPVIVAETGWPGAGQSVAAAVPSPVNAMRYFIVAREWARREGVALFYFSSFGEPLRLGQEGEVGTGAMNFDLGVIAARH